METKINLTTTKALSSSLKEIARSKGMKFHAYLNFELEKIAKREAKKNELQSNEASNNS